MKFLDFIVLIVQGNNLIILQYIHGGNKFYVFYLKIKKELYNTTINSTIDAFFGRILK